MRPVAVHGDTRPLFAFGERTVVRLFPVVAITGCTGSDKTRLALALARHTGATVVPLDQLHRYMYLQEGTGLDSHELASV